MAISIDDRLLVESHRAGDRAAFEAIVRVHQGPLMAHALRSLHDRAAAEDAVQETLLRAYRALPRFDGEYKVGPWLHRILANVCVDEANRRRREGEKFDRAAVETNAADLVEPGVEDALGLDADTTSLRDALAGLSPTYQEALLLRFVDGMPYEEVARTTGVTEENARARVSRARTAMKTLLKGVAAVPALAIGALRSGERAASAAELAGSAGSAGSASGVIAQSGSGVSVPASPAAHAAAHGAHVAQSSPAAQAASQVAPVASSGAGLAAQAAPAVQAAGALAPAVEVAHAVAVAAPAATPLLAKAALGLGLAAAVAVPTAGPALLQRDTTPVPAVAAPAPVVADPAPTSGSAAGTAAAPAQVDSTGAADDDAGASLDATATADAERSATPAPSASDVGITPLPAAPPASSDTAAPVGPDGVEPAPAPAAPVVVAPVIERSGGTVSVRGLTLTPAGPRVDLSGPAALLVGPGTYTGALSGRVSVADAAPGEARRIDGTVVVRLDDGRLVEIRLAGFATPTDPDGPGTGIPGTSSLSGTFRATSPDEVALVLSGSFTGSLDPATGTFSLSLT